MLELQVSIRQRSNKVVINKAPGGNDNFYNEAKRPDEGWAPSFKLGPRKSALAVQEAINRDFAGSPWGGRARAIVLSKSA